MAFTIYGLLTNNATAAGPYLSSGSVTAITGANPAAGVNFFGYVELEGRSKFFYNSNGAGQFGGVALPTLATPNFIPAGFVQIGSSAIYVLPAQAFIPDPSGGNQFQAAQAGALFFAVNFAGSLGSPDASSATNTFTVDPTTLFFIDSLTTELP